MAANRHETGIRVQSYRSGSYAAAVSDPGLCAEVRRHCRTVAESARWVEIDISSSTATSGVDGLDPELHFLDAPTEDVARYVLILDTINFGSGWFPSLRTPAHESATTTITRRLTAHARRHEGPWTATELRALDVRQVAHVLGQEANHPLMRLYAHALSELGSWLGNRTARETIDAAEGSAERFAHSLASGMRFFDDTGFWKRAQITANDLALAGAADFADVDRLTAFADNLIPHVLRLDGVLSYAPALAALVDTGTCLQASSPMEVEIRACAVHACELIAERLSVPPRTLDNWLWNRGNKAPYRDRPTHLTKTVFY